MIRNIMEPFLKGKKDYCWQVRGGNFWSRNDIEQESNGEINKTLSIEECLNKIKP